MKSIYQIPYLNTSRSVLLCCILPVVIFLWISLAWPHITHAAKSIKIEKAFVQRGGVIQAKIPYKSRQPHFRDIISKAILLNPDAIFIAGHDESARIIREAIQMGLNAIPLGGDGWDELGMETPLKMW